MRVAPDGTPIREPLTDILRGESHLSVIMELPGVEGDDIELNTSDTKVTLHVESGNRIYDKEVELGCRVDPSSVEATFKNGILEVRIDRL
jgi:HSP20 family protein